MTRTIFQISQSMIDSSSTLMPEDLGLWCFLYKGRYHGFSKTPAEAYLAEKSLLKDES